MGIHPNHPTPYPEINAILLDLKSRIQTVLAEQLTGMYLYGSLALGDFDLQKSDIDFLVVTKENLRKATFQALKSMHAEFATCSSKWATELEGSYISKRALERSKNM